MPILSHLPILIPPILPNGPLLFERRPCGFWELGKPCHGTANARALIQAWQGLSSNHLTCRQKAVEIQSAIAVAEIFQHVLSERSCFQLLW